MKVTSVITFLMTLKKVIMFHGHRPKKKNVKRKIFTPTADKLKGNTIKRKDTDKDADKQENSSSKEKDTSKDAEKDEESNTEEYSDGNIEKDINRGSKGLFKDSSEDSDSSHKKSSKKAPKKRRVRYNFRQYYKGPRCFFPGTGYKFKFENIQDEEARNYLLMILKKKKQAIREQLNKLFRGKSFDFSGSRKKFPCILDKDCQFVGNNLSRHLKSKAHSTAVNQARLLESFVTHSVNFITLVIKSVSRTATLCDTCKIFFERIKSDFT